MLKGSTWIVDRGFIFRTVSFHHEKVPNFGRIAKLPTASFPAVVIRMRSCFNTMFFFIVCLVSTWMVDLGPNFQMRQL